MRPGTDFDLAAAPCAQVAPTYGIEPPVSCSGEFGIPTDGPLRLAPPLLYVLREIGRRI